MFEHPAITFSPWVPWLDRDRLIDDQQFMGVYLWGHFHGKPDPTRIPEPFRSMDDFTLQALLKGTIDNARERVRRSYKTAIPQYYKGQVQLLLPPLLQRPTEGGPGACCRAPPDVLSRSDLSHP